MTIHLEEINAAPQYFFSFNICHLHLIVHQTQQLRLKVKENFRTLGLTVKLSLKMLNDNIQKDTSLGTLFVHDSVSTFPAADRISGTNLVIVMAF